MPLIMTFLGSNWKPIFILLCFSLWSIGCYQQGIRHLQAKWDLANAEAVIKARQSELDKSILNATIGDKNEKTHNTIDIIYADAINSLSGTTNLNLPAESSTKPKIDARACTDAIHQADFRATKKAIIDIQKAAEENTADWLGLQEYVRAVCISK